MNIRFFALSKRPLLLYVLAISVMIPMGILTGIIQAEHERSGAVNGLFDTSPGGTSDPTPTPTFDAPSSTPTRTPTATPEQTPPNRAISLSSADYDVIEGYTTQIGINASITGGRCDAYITTSDGTAAGGTTCGPGVDYITVNRPLNFSSVDAYGEVLIVTCPDTLRETDETLMITLLPGYHSTVVPPSHAVVTIHSQPVPPTPLPSPTAPACSMSYSYSNNNPIAINDFRPPNGLGADPYPSAIRVNDVLPISNVSVKLSGVNHTRPDDIDLMLVGPGGENAIIMSDAGGGIPFAGDLTFDDTAPSELPDEGPIVSGTFRPTNVGGGDTFPFGTRPFGGSSLSVFNGTLSDGLWSLWAWDDSIGNAGSIADGWEITFQVCPTASPTPTSEPSPTPPPEICSSNGVLDRTFDGDGRRTSSALGLYDQANAVALQPDGKIVAAGQSYDGGYAYFALTRFNTDGTLDPSFGTDGSVATSFYGTATDAANAIAIQRDGKIVAVGSSFYLVRYNPDGTRDTTFGTGGKVVTFYGGSDARAVAIQPDGKIVAAGSILGDPFVFAVVRYNADGTLDNTFDSDGIVTTRILNKAEGRSVAIQADGKIVVAGKSEGGFALARYNTNGSLDTSFDLDGKLTTVVSGMDDTANSVVIQPDGKLIAAGTSQDHDIALVRYNPNGTLDTTFDGDGKVITPIFAASNDSAFAAGLQADGRIVAAGATVKPNDSRYNFALVRYNSDGSLDGTFDTDGKVVTQVVNGRDDCAFAMAIQPDGKIVAAGSSGIGSSGIGDFALVRYGCDAYHPPALFDYDGDDRTDISVFRPSNRTWYLQRSTDGFYTRQFGSDGDRLAPADYSGDKRTDITVYRPSPGTWNILDSATGTVTYKAFGVAEDLPVPGDYDGDGTTDVSVFRPSTSTWYRQNSSDGSFYAQQFGASGDKPVIGDYDGDGKADLSVFRPSTGIWYQLYSSDSSLHGRQFGFDTDIPVQSDYDGDGKTDIAVYRPSEGYWYIANSSDGSVSYAVFGLADDIPAPGDFDGDGKSDISVFRPSDGTWYRTDSSTGQFVAFPFGTAGDQPTQTAFRY